MKKLNFWLCLVLFLTLAQTFYSVNSFSQIRYEELSESVRNVYWLENGLVFSGINAHLGWYTPLRLVYHLFGFSFESVKYFRLFLHVISISCIVLLLARFLGIKKSLLPVITIGLSPTLLFFNTLGNHYGVDLQYLPICLYLLSILKWDEGILKFLPHILLWALVMLAWSAYPTFIYYVPAFIFTYNYLLSKSHPKLEGKSRYITLSFLSFIIPIILMSTQVVNRNILISDPNVGGGLFRGAGNITFDPAASFQNIYQTSLAFLNLVPSYYYEVKQSELSNFYPLISVTTVLLLSVFLYIKKKKYRLLISLAFGVVVVNLIILAFFSDSSGPASIRRATGFLAAFYFYYAMGFKAIFEFKFKPQIIIVLIGLLSLLPLHHLLSYLPNLDNMISPSPEREEFWFNNRLLPQDSLANLVEKASRGDLKLYTEYPLSKNPNYSFGLAYNWVFGSVKGACLWNNLSCHNLYGYDVDKKSFILLNLHNVNYTLTNEKIP